MRHKSGQRKLPAAEHDAVRLDSFLCFAMYSANLAVSRIYRPLLEPLGVTYVQYLVLVSLWKNDGQLVGELGERLFLASSTLTPVLKRLETTGYLKRIRDHDDQRQVRVQLTAPGRALRKQACDVPHALLTESGLGAREIKLLQDAMLALRDRLLASPLLLNDSASTPAVRRRQVLPPKRAGTSRKASVRRTTDKTRLSVSVRPRIPKISG